MDSAQQPVAQNWDKFWSKSSGAAPKEISWSKRRILKIVSPYSLKNCVALDAGCGSGFFSKYFCDQGMVTYALDYSQEALDITRKAAADKVIILKKDLLSSQLTNELDTRFDLIFSDGLLEHFDEGQQSQILKNLSSLLKEDGVVISFVPNRWSPWELIRPFYMPEINETPFVLRTLVSLHERNSLQVVNFGGINVLPFRLSPERLLGKHFGMLLFVVAKKIL